VSVYLKQYAFPIGGELLRDSSCAWRRVQINEFGPLNAGYTGTIHHVASMKDSTTNIDAFAIACIGARKLCMLLFHGSTC